MNRFIKGAGQLQMKLKSILFFILVMTQLAQSQNSVAEIDLRVAAIQKSLSLCKHVEQVRTPTAFREVYLKGEDVCFVRVRSMEQDTDKEVSWYYQGSKLIYCETNWVDFRGISTFSESHYLVDDALIAWTENNESIKKDSDKFKARAELLKVAGSELLSKVQSQ